MYLLVTIIILYHKLYALNFTILNYFTCILLVIFSLQNSYGQTNTTEELDARVKFILDSLENKFRFPGFAMIVVKDTSTIYEMTYGVKKINNSPIINNQTLFYWASVSKVFTATAVMKLVEEGKLKLNDRVTKYYPEFKTKQGNYNSDSITILHLLTHTSGLPKHFDDNLLLIDQGSTISSKEHFKNFTKTSLMFDPGTSYLYSNIGIQILGIIIENVSGQSFEEYVQSLIFHPLEIKNTTFYQRDNLTDTTLASPHIWKRGKLIPEYRLLYTNFDNSAGGIKSSIYDMGIWMKACIKMGLRDEDLILKHSTFKEMWNNSLPVIIHGEKSYVKGLAWDCNEYKGHPFAAKGGNFEWKSRSYVIIFKDIHLGIALVSNFHFEEWDKVILSIIDEVLIFETRLK
jgi:CubicO group peptidase (beta-lactamase class C family)